MYLEAKKAGESQEVQTKTPKQVLLDAADLLEREGWCQHRYYSEGARCIQGAIYAVNFTLDQLNSVDNNDPRFQAEKVLWKMVGGGAITNWNDSPERTKQEVIAMLRKAAVIA